MNQPIKNPQQRPMNAQPQGNRPQGMRPTGQPGMRQGAPTGQPAQRRMPQQAGMNPQGRPVQPQGRPAQVQGRPIQPQGRPAQVQGRPVVQANPNNGHQPVQQRPIQQTSPVQSTQPEQQSQQPAHSPYLPNFASDFNLPPAIITTKGILILFICTLIFGMIFGSIFFGGDDSSPKQSGGLNSLVVRNEEIKTKLPLCGRTDPGQACVLYLMNTTRYDKIAENFFDDVAKLTELQNMHIAHTNMRYAKKRIPPGAFAQIKVPNVR